MEQQRRIYRILDANLNRAAEGLRVLEELGRFLLDRGELSLAAKELRHDLAAAAQVIPGGRRRLVAARDAAGDVGAPYSPREGRAGVADLAAANVRRVAEALRALEEFGKLASPDAAPHFKELRFRAYGLEQRLYEALDATEGKGATVHDQRGDTGEDPR